MVQDVLNSSSLSWDFLVLSWWIWNDKILLRWIHDVWYMFDQNSFEMFWIFNTRLFSWQFINFTYQISSFEEIRLWVGFKFDFSRFLVAVCLCLVFIDLLVIQNALDIVDVKYVVSLFFFFSSPCSSLLLFLSATHLSTPNMHINIYLHT